MITENDFRGLNPKQRESICLYYLENKHLLSSHKRDWKYHYENDEMMAHVNEIFDPLLHNYDGYLDLGFIEIDSIKYIFLKKYNCIALFNYETNETYTFHLIYWKNTHLEFWSNSNSGYLKVASGETMFGFFGKEALEVLHFLDEFKYIDFSKLSYGNPYILLNERNNKQKLWQIEMLVKQGYYLLAEDLCSSYSTIDFKILKNYLDFFKKKGKRLGEYNKILKLREKGFVEPEYMYLQKYLDSWGDNWFVDFLTEHPQMNRSRFLKYIKNRKGSMNKFGNNFLSLYRLYLMEVSDLKLDLSKDKYAFPSDLVKAMEDHLLSINPYEYKHQRFSKIFDHWQSELPKNEQSDIYVSRIVRLEKEEKRRVQLAQKRAKEKERFLKFLWEFNKHIEFQVNDLYVLTAPRSSEDLLIEGKTLNHCVGSYVERIAKRETSIYFLRKKDYLNQPFYTIEIKNGKVQQCRTTNNQVNPEILSLVSSWIDSNPKMIPSWDLENEVPNNA